MVTVLSRQWKPIVVVFRQWKPIAGGILCTAAFSIGIEKAADDRAEWWWWIVVAAALVGMLGCALWGVLSENARARQKSQREREMAEAAR